jgi:hypothetical protein
VEGIAFPCVQTAALASIAAHITAPEEAAAFSAD